MRQAIQSAIQPLLIQGADTLVLGCTHYNFIADVIADVAGPGTTMVRTEIAVAKQLQQRLAQAQLLNSSVEVGADNFYTSGDLGLFNRQLLRLWPADATAFPL
jgi:glutamate racemase